MQSIAIDPAFMLIVVLSCYLCAYIHKKSSRFSKIPTIGPDGVLTSWMGSFMMVKNGHRMVMEACKQHRIFKISRYFSWLVVASGNDYMEDIRKASNTDLSFMGAFDQDAQLDYTIGPRLLTSEYHIDVIRGRMTRNINARFDDIMDEIGIAFGENLKCVDKEWITVSTYSTVVEIVSRITARFFVGPELSSNARYRDVMQGFTKHVFLCGTIIAWFPKFLKPFVSRFLFDIPSKIEEVEDFLKPLVTKRLMNMNGALNPTEVDVEGEQNDMVAWLLDATQTEDQRNVKDIAERMILTSIAAIHTTSTLLTQVLYNLATYQEYIEPLREEIQQAVDTNGWVRSAIDQGLKLDSFIKETQRVHNSTALAGVRKVMSDSFVFHDGTVVPNGTLISIVSQPINHDESLYPNPLEFQGFRFAGMEDKKQRMTAITNEFLTFGIGRHACPGRFFAVSEIKVIVARLLLEYDIKLHDEKAGRPKNSWFIGISLQPDKKASLCFRKRHDC